MASYIIKTFPQTKYSFRLYHNTKKKTWQQIKKETGCYGIVNTAYFSLTTYKVESYTIIAGKTLFKSPYHEYGLCIDKNGKLTVGTEREATYDYTVGLPPCYINGAKYASYQEYGKNGATFIGLSRSGDVTCLMSGKDYGMTTAQCCSVLLKAGCSDIFRFDGSWSTQGSLGPGLDLDPSKERKVAVYLLIYDKSSPTTSDTKPTTDNNSITKSIQSALNSKYSAGLTVDGSFGPASKKAMIKAVQTEINRLYNGKLTIDGSFGPASKRACPKVRKITKNNLVWLIQACLAIKGYDIEIDGSYGGGTETIIKQFQTKNGLSATGICDVNTFVKLLS